MIRARTDGIVIHRAEVWLNRKGEPEYNFLVHKDGSIETLVPLNERAPHAIAFNGSTVGVAVFGCFARALPGRNYHPTEAQLTACVLLCQGLRWWYGKPLWVKGHTELGAAGTSQPLKLSYDPDNSCPGLNLDLDALRVRIG